MARASRVAFQDETLARLRRMPLAQVLDTLADQGGVLWRRDADFVPERDQRTVRLVVTSPSGLVSEIVATGVKWYDLRSGKGGGGGIDLAMHVLDIDFVRAVKLLTGGTGAATRGRSVPK
jgi:hypothetical protein